MFSDCLASVIPSSATSTKVLSSSFLSAHKLSSAGSTTVITSNERRKGTVPNFIESKYSNPHTVDNGATTLMHLTDDMFVDANTAAADLFSTLDTKPLTLPIPLSTDAISFVTASPNSKEFLEQLTAPEIPTLDIHNMNHSNTKSGYQRNVQTATSPAVVPLCSQNDKKELNRNKSSEDCDESINHEEERIDESDSRNSRNIEAERYMPTEGKTIGNNGAFRTFSNAKTYEITPSEKGVSHDQEQLKKDPKLRIDVHLVNDTNHVKDDTNIETDPDSSSFNSPAMNSSSHHVHHQQHYTQPHPPQTTNNFDLTLPIETKPTISPSFQNQPDSLNSIPYQHQQQNINTVTTSAAMPWATNLPLHSVPQNSAVTQAHRILSLTHINSDMTLPVDTKQALGHDDIQEQKNSNLYQQHYPNPTHGACFPAPQPPISTSIATPAATTLMITSVDSDMALPIDSKTFQTQQIAQHHSDKTMSNSYQQSQHMNSTSTPWYSSFPPPQPPTTTITVSTATSSDPGITKSSIVKKTTRKPKTYSKPVASRFCHICSRMPRRGQGSAVCKRISEGLCRKIVCEQCITDHGWDYQSIKANMVNWACPHCMENCPARSQCHIYNRINARRKRVGSNNTNITSF